MPKVPANIMPNNYIYFRPFIPAFIIHQLRKLNTGDCIIVIEFLLGVQNWCSTANNEQVLAVRLSYAGQLFVERIEIELQGNCTRLAGN